jgi:hypothetical protein
MEATAQIPLDLFTAWCDLAGEFNEYVPPERLKTAAPSSSDAKGDRPGDEFNRRATWHEILEPHGWQVCRTSGDITYWTRPGKNPSAGTSATTGKCKTDASGDLLYIFSTNALPFDGGHAYDKFGAFARLNHSGDFYAATKAVCDLGYGNVEPTLVMPTAEEVALIGQHTGGMTDDGVTPDYNFATNDDLKKLGISLKWVWDGWLQLGAVNLVAAEAGMGKTRFAADLVRRVHEGGTWPDGSPVPKWENKYIAMWVAADGNHAELLTLSESFGFGDRICYSGTKENPIGGTTLDMATDFNMLHRKVKAAAPLFLFIDTAGGATSKNLSKQEEAREFFGPASAIAARRQICVVVITHLNSNKTVLGKRAEERVRTVTRMSAENREPATPRRIEIIKSNSLFPPPLGMMLGETGNTYDDNPPPKPEDAGSVRSDPKPVISAEPAVDKYGCMDWLASILARWPIRVSDIRKACESAGYSTKSLYKAKAGLGVEEYEMNGYKWWKLSNNNTYGDSEGVVS